MKEKPKNLRLRKDSVVIQLSSKKGYIFDYDLANVFYRALASFNNTQVVEYDGFNKIVAVNSYEDDGNYIKYGKSVKFQNLDEYLDTCINRHLKNGLVYDVNRNSFDLDYETLHKIERSK